ncbi:MAG: hypothetical protein KDA61_09155 [Planctomycetales bacterium]|nr:hypothetical protein [Planctomycetales bacterium]
MTGRGEERLCCREKPDWKLCATADYFWSAARGILAASLFLTQLATSASRVAAAELHVDDFAASAQGWTGGASPVNVASGGPAGAGDGYLQISAAGSNLATHTSQPQWTGDFETLGANQVSVDLRNAPGSAELQMRLVLFGPGTSPSNAARWTSATPLVAPADGVWRTYSFDITPESLVQVAGAAVSFESMWRDVENVMLRHDPGTPSAGGSAVSATLGIDNVALRIASQPIEGDFNGDQAVTAADLVVWESNFGDGGYDGSDFLTWQRNRASGAPAALTAPEPTGGMAIGFGSLVAFRRRRRR